MNRPGALRFALAAALAVLSVSVLAPSPARACGGFFCSAATQSPIYQAGERIVFVKHGQRVTMHIEVRYEGEPTEFAWLLPLPEHPQGADGQPLPLDEAVTISSPRLFDALDAATVPQFTVNGSVEDNDECDGFSCGASEVSASARGGFAPNLGGESPDPDVKVVDAARVGPYDAQLIEAQSSQALYDWLNANGYYQDPAAKQLLGHYLGLGYVFLGIRLQSGKDTGDLRPIALTFNEQAPCVPLRLTGIAATPDMPITVFVAGPGRAVPKNFIHAVVNPMALDWPNVTNYFDVVKDAVDTASGRAWVTESSGPVALAPDLVIAPQAVAAFQAADSLRAVLEALWTVAEDVPFVIDVIEEAVCWRPADAPGGGDGCVPVTDPDAEPSVRLSQLWSADQADRQGDATLSVDLGALRQRLDRTVVGPLSDIVPLMKDRTVTRFFTMLDPDEMIRDPLFAFNAQLPDVPRLNALQLREFQDESCDRFQTRTYPNGVTRTVACGDDGCPFSVGPVPGAPALEFPEVLDETGAPLRFHLDQVAEIDALLDGAQPGSPSLPAQLELRDPAAPPKVDSAKPNLGGCAADPRGVEWLLVVALGLLIGRAATRRARGVSS